MFQSHLLTTVCLCVAELQLHRQHVDTHFEGVSAMLTSCRMELQELEASIREKNTELMASLSNVEANIQTASNSQRYKLTNYTFS